MQKNSEKADEKIGIVAIAASEGGVEALQTLLQEMPADFPAPIVVVQHLAPTHDSVLDRIIQTRSTLAVKWADHHEWLKAGTVYLAPSDRHLAMAAPDLAALSDAPAVNWVRPSADVLFKSVARHYRKRSIGVVLTGNLRDGAAGALAIKDAGGWVLAQDEDSSQRFDMPRCAIQNGAVDYVMPLDSLHFALVSLTMAFGATSLFRAPRRTWLPSPAPVHP